jgi:hypothetical protein
MFIRPCYRRKNGKQHAYWALVESHRTARGPRQRVVAYLGQMPEPKRRGVQRAAAGEAAPSLFEDAAREWVEVDAKRLRVERSRDFGAPWLGLQLLRRLELTEFLEEIMPGTRAEIRRRCVTRPDEHQAILLQRLDLNLPSNVPVTDEKLGRM